MKKFWILLMVFAVGATAVSLAPQKTAATISKIKRAANPIPNRYVVVFDPLVISAVSESSHDAANRMTEYYGGGIDKVYSAAIQGFSAEMTPKEADRMSRDSRVLFIEEDAEISIAATQPNATWGLDRVDQRNVPLNTAYTYAQTGAGVNVYVLDTGIRATHAEFGDRASAAFDSIGDGQNGNDCHGHGTHVAGTIGGSTYGIAKNVNLYGVRVVGCNGSGTVSTLVDGIDWVTANRVSPAVVNMSLGSSSVSELLDFVITNSISTGITYVIGAGNSNANACMASPSRVPNAITVGASDSMDAKADFSNFGSCVDIFAPGVGIQSAWNWNNTASNIASGTSMATPHVAGAAALFLETNPAASPAQVADNIASEATSGMMSGLDSASPNLLIFTNPFAPTAADASVEGRIVSNNGRGIRNVRVSLQNGNTSEFRTALTNAFGYFRFDALESGMFYVVSVRHKNYIFAQSSFAFSLNENLAGVEFIGVPR